MKACPWRRADQEKSAAVVLKKCCNGEGAAPLAHGSSLQPIGDTETAIADINTPWGSVSLHTPLVLQPPEFPCCR